MLKSDDRTPVKEGISCPLVLRDDRTGFMKETQVDELVKDMLPLATELRKHSYDTLNQDSDDRCVCGPRYYRRRYGGLSLHLAEIIAEYLKEYVQRLEEDERH